MRISDVGNTVVYTRGLSEYILLVNGKSQVGIWLRNWVARVGNEESESSLCRSSLGARSTSPAYTCCHFVLLLRARGKQSRLLGSELLCTRAAWFVLFGTLGIHSRDLAKITAFSLSLILLRGA
jgi:hypothetical protein